MSSALSTPLAPVSAPTTAAVLGDIIPANSRIQAWLRDIALIVTVVGITALAARISFTIPGTVVPVTGQTFGVLLGAASIGPWRGALAQVLYVGLGVLGLPLWAGGTAGSLAALGGTTGGYLLGFIAASILVGWLARLRADRRVLSSAAAFAAGTVVIYAIGVPWLAVTGGMSLADAAFHGAAIFVAGDLLKALAAGLLLPAIWKSL